LWKTNKKFETTVQVINQGTALRGSGGIGWIATGAIVEDVKVLWMPDLHTFIWNDQGKFTEERNVLHVSKKVWDNTPFIVGKTLVQKDGKEFRVINCFDYSDFKQIGVVEIEVVRKVDVE